MDIDMEFGIEKICHADNEKWEKTNGQKENQNA